MREATAVVERKSSMDRSKVLFWGVLATVMIMSSSAYCASGNDVQEIEAMTNSVMNTIFSPWVKKIALVFGGGAGLCQAYAAGSIKPLLLWGGLGLAVNYVPKVVDVIGSL